MVNKPKNNTKHEHPVDGIYVKIMIFSLNANSKSYVDFIQLQNYLNKIKPKTQLSFSFILFFKKKQNWDIYEYINI